MPFHYGIVGNEWADTLTTAAYDQIILIHQFTIPQWPICQSPRRGPLHLGMATGCPLLRQRVTKADAPLLYRLRMGCVPTDQALRRIDRTTLLSVVYVWHTRKRKPCHVRVPKVYSQERDSLRSQLRAAGIPPLTSRTSSFLRFVSSDSFCISCTVVLFVSDGSGSAPVAIYNHQL